MPPFAEIIGAVPIYSEEGRYAGYVRVERRHDGAVVISIARHGAGSEVGAIWAPEKARDIADLLARASAPFVERRVDHG